MEDLLAMGKCPDGGLESFVKKYFPNLTRRSESNQETYGNDGPGLHLDVMKVNSARLPEEYRLPEGYDMLLYLMSEVDCSKEILQSAVEEFKRHTGINLISGPDIVRIRLRDEKIRRLAQESERDLRRLIFPF